jgi:hypothetical protein
MYKVSLEEVRQLCKEVVTGVRIKEKDEKYSDSLNFYLTNDFFFEECWNLDATLSALILPRLIHFRDNRCGTPGCLFEYDEKGNILNEEEGCQKWEKILDKMIWAFYLYISVDSLYWTEEQKQQINEGLKLFAEYFQSLWD